MRRALSLPCNSRFAPFALWLKMSGMPAWASVRAIRRGVCVALACALIGLPVLARAQTGSACDVPGYLAVPSGTLPRALAEIKTTKTLSITVLGTASSVLVGQDALGAAYPARLEIALQKKLEGVEVKVNSVIQTRQTAADQWRQLGRILSEKRPSLVIWQTGTYDAIRGVEPDQMRIVLDKGIEAARAAGADVMLVNMQYSPRTANLIALNDYIDIMRLVSQEKEALLFDRYGVMRYWFDTRQFDLYARARGMTLARRVHDCLGRAMAAVIVDALPLNAPGEQVKP